MFYGKLNEWSRKSRRTCEKSWENLVISSKCRKLCWLIIKIPRNLNLSSFCVFPLSHDKDGCVVRILELRGTKVVQSDPCLPPCAVARDSRLIIFSCVETILDCFLLCSFVDECEKGVLSFMTAGFFLLESHTIFKTILLESHTIFKTISVKDANTVVQVSLEVDLLFRNVTAINSHRLETVKRLSHLGMICN